MEQYQKEAKEKWGETQAYQTCEDKTAHYTQAQWAQIHREMDEIMFTFARYCKEGISPESLPVREQVSRWQQFMTKYYYDCTPEILRALGRMYGADPRFRENIDKYGPGTAAFLSEAIENFCQST